MSVPAVTIPARRAGTHREAVVVVPQYSVTRILVVWVAAALPMAVLAWLAAPAVADRFDGDGDVPMAKALLLVLTGGLVWQFVLVVALVWREQHTFRWSTLREVLWLRSPRSPRSGRVGGRIWLVLIPLVVAYAVVSFVLPRIPHADSRDFGSFLESDAGQSFMHGNWGWYGLMLALFLFNTVLGEELLFRGFLLPRMNGSFGRLDWLANGVLFAAYHLHVPWVFLETLVGDTLILSYVEALPKCLDRHRRPQRPERRPRGDRPRTRPLSPRPPLEE